ncbi:MAG: biotin/lipoyl-binding protein [bacterium]|nr:biotin/lipoyl-binding protein [bacterium]
MKKKIIVLIVASLFGFGAFASSEISTKINTKPQVAQVASIYKGVVILHVKLGQEVKKGQVLFEVNSDMLKVQLDRDKSHVDNNAAILDGARKLVNNHSISRDDYQQCLRDYLAAKNSYELDLAQINDSMYYSPFDGTVTNIVRYEGSGLGDNDNEVEVTEGKVKVNTTNKEALICNRWPGVLDLKVKIGQKVKKGQLLYEIDTKDAIAQLDRDKNYLKYAIKEYQRLSMLRQSKTVSLLKLVEAKIAYEDALATVKTDKIQIEQSSGYAPFDGTVKSIERYSGSGNGAGKPVLTLIANS